ncbi:hypothetical protein CWI39_1976p0010, partial [Hamiltosporidium magnivora]
EITINEEIRVSGSGNIGVLFTNDSFIKITVLNEKFYNILNGLCSNVKGGVNYRNISITKNVLRGMCVKGGCFYEGVIEFLRFGYFKQKDVCREIGVEVIYIGDSKGNVLKVGNSKGNEVIHIGDSKGNVLKVGNSKGNLYKGSKGNLYRGRINNSNSNNSSISNGNSVVIKMC